MCLPATLVMSFTMRAMARPRHHWRMAHKVENIVHVYWHKDLFLNTRGTSGAMQTQFRDFVKEQTQQKQQLTIA